MADAKAEAKKVEVRVLKDGAFGKCNAVVELDSETAKSHVGEVDADPAAVAYAKSLKK